MAKQRQLKYRVSANGAERGEQLRAELDGLLDIEAVASAKRRRSQTVDESDFEQAFQELVGRRRADFARQLISTALYLLAGGAASWAVNAYTSADVPDVQGHWATVTMTACFCLGAFVQHWRGWP